MRNKKIFYFCKRGTGAHLHLYSGWVKEGRRIGLPIYLFTTVSFRQFFKIPTTFKRKEFIFIPSIKIFDRLVVTIFFILQFLKNKYVVIHLRKRDPRLFDILRLFFRNFMYIIEREGDFKYEKDYLLEHPYKKGFYSGAFKLYDNNIKKDEDELKRADHIICVSDNLKKLYMTRYNIDEKKITSLITAVDSNTFKYNEKIRQRFRKKSDLENSYVLVYIGKLFYSWQNISRTLEVYKIIKELKKNTKLIIITREEDKPIILDFLNKHGIEASEIIIKFSLPHGQIPNYLNAADTGIILRDDHPMNHVASPGKFGEYLCCGLPVIAGKGTSDFSEKLSETPHGIVLDNIHDDREIKMKFNKFMKNYKNLDRKVISDWGRKNFSYKPYIRKYKEIFKNMIND